MSLTYTNLGDTKAHIMSVQFDEEAKTLLAGTRNGEINSYSLYYAGLESQIDQFELPENPADYTNVEVKYPVTCLKWRPRYGGMRNRGIFAASYGNNQIKVYSSTSPTPLHTIVEGDNKGVYSIDYNTSGSLLVSGGQDATLRIYDAEKLKVVQEYKPGYQDKVHHFNRIHCVKFNPENDNILFSGGADKQI
jgi:WD40 repeat protein